MAEAYSKHNVKPNKDDKYRQPKYDGSYRPCDSCMMCESYGEDLSDTICGHQQLKKRPNTNGYKDRD